MYRYFVYIEKDIVKTNSLDIVVKLYNEFSDDYNIRILDNNLGYIFFNLEDLIDNS